MLFLFLHSARFLVQNIKPVGVGVIFPVVGALGVFYSLSFLLKTGCTDPGILPRGQPDELEYMQALGDVGKAIQLVCEAIQCSTYTRMYTVLVACMCMHKCHNY